MHFCGGGIHFDGVALRLSCLVGVACVKFSLLNFVIFVNICFEINSPNDVANNWRHNIGINVVLWIMCLESRSD